MSESRSRRRSASATPSRRKHRGDSVKNDDELIFKAPGSAKYRDIILNSEEYKQEESKNMDSAPNDGKRRRKISNKGTNQFSNSQRDTPKDQFPSSSSVKRRHRSTSKGGSRTSSHKSSYQDSNQVDTPNSTKSSRRQAPPLPLDDIKDEISRKRRSKSTKISRHAESHHELQKNSDLYSNDKDTKRRYSSHRQQHHELADNSLFTEDQPPRIKTLREILAEKPKFSSKLQDKTNKNEVKKEPEIPKVTPTRHRHQPIDNTPDDYRARRIGNASIHSSITYAPENETLGSSVKIHNPSAKNRSASASASKGFNPPPLSINNSELKTTPEPEPVLAGWTPAPLLEDEFTTGGGDIFIARQNQISASASSSQFNTMTGEEIAAAEAMPSKKEIKANQSSKSEAGTFDDKKDRNSSDNDKQPSLRARRGYKPPSLKRFDAVPISRFESLLTPVDAPKLRIREQLSPAAETPSPRPRHRTRRPL